MTIERKQISVWISAESAALLQRLKQDRGGSIGSIIECAIAAYATSEPTSVDTSIPTSSSLDWSAAIDDLRDEMNSRVLVLEIRLAALEAIRAVTVEPSAIVAENVALRAVGSDDSSIHPESTADQEQAIDARIVALRKEGNGIKVIREVLHVGQKRVYRVLEAAGL